MTLEAPLEPTLLIEQEMHEPSLLRLGPGRVMLFSKRSPLKSTPNEDALAVIPTSATDAVLVVADGMGGLPGGRRSSALAVKAMARAIEQGLRAKEELRTSILAGFESANKDVLDIKNGGTTLAVAEIVGRRLRTYHVGDSVVLVTGRGGVKKLETIAHSPTGYAVESGMLDDDDALVHEDRHLITNAVGSAEMHIDVGSGLELAERDTVLLASDGLTDNLYLAEIVESVCKGRLDQAAERLLRRCEQRMREPESGHPCKPDDLSFILYRAG